MTARPPAMTHIHEYRSRLKWQGSTAQGWEHYDRTHRVEVPPAAAELVLSSDAAFRGDPRLLNPEQLLVVAASSCQMLAFLAIAARSRVDVLSYEDQAEAVMPEDAEPMRITRIELRPRIVVAEGADIERVRRIADKAHDQCYIANTLNAEVAVEPTIEHAG